MTFDRLRAWGLRSAQQAVIRHLIATTVISCTYRRQLPCPLHVALLRLLCPRQAVLCLHRYDVLGEFMEYIARSPVVEEVPAVMVAYLGVLTSLATSTQGAQVLYVYPIPGLRLTS